MSFFDKFLSHINKNKHENQLHADTKPLSFKSSNLSFSKDQIRFVLFRECERRGRKLLFDSNAVEKLLLPSRKNLCNQKCQQPNNEKIIDFIETTNTHGYKYKKPSSDVASLGEMIFGTVAMVYKGENSCKIHSIPSPKQVIFTTIVHAPSRYQLTNSKCSLEGSSMESSLSSLNEVESQKQTSSSDSRLYRRQEVTQKCSSTYPWLKHNSPFNKITQCCEISDIDSCLNKLSLCKNDKINCLEGLCNEKNHGSDLCNLKESRETISERLLTEGEFMNNCDNLFVNSNISNDFENVSSVSGSLSSLRRRWNQSYSTSLDSGTFENTTNSPFRKKTKLGLALVLDLKDTMQDEIEKLLYNHTIIIDCIMRKLQASVELAYIKNENFVDLIHTAFSECQQSMYDLITNEKYTSAVWTVLIGNPEDSFCGTVTEKHNNEGSANGCNSQDSVDNLKLKFLDDFCDILVKFDTKDTNFFISTLLTAVLTHHLSWVTAIAETDIFTKQKKLQSVIHRPYNPLWAQLNDLCGLLGSPLKCARTIITGEESKRSTIGAIIQVLTYFIRCYNVVENIYDMNIGDIVENADLKKNSTSCVDGYFSDIDSDIQCNSTLEKDKFVQKPVNTQIIFSDCETEKSSDEEQEFIQKFDTMIKNVQNSDKSTDRLKRSKSILSHMELDSVGPTKLYPDLKDLAKTENVNVDDVDYADTKRTFSVGKFLSNEELCEKNNKMIRVPKKTSETTGGYLSPDEGYDTIDSMKTEEHYVRKVQMEKQCSVPPEKNKNILFLLGDNEELVKSPKKVVLTKSLKIELEREVSKNSNVDSEGIVSNLNSFENTPLRNGENKSVEECRTFENYCNASGTTLSSCCVENTNNHCFSQAGGGNACRLSWMVRELQMPRTPGPSKVVQLGISSVLGGVNEYYNSEQVIQGVVNSKNHWKQSLQKDLFLCAHDSILEKDLNEAICVLGDVDSWEVSLCSSNISVLDRKKNSGIRVGMSQLVADMLESFLQLRKINLSPDFCFLHIERKLHEIYLKSKTVAELLNSTEMCNMDYLIKKLDIEINDVPLLLSVASTHSPQISQKYGLSFT